MKIERRIDRLVAQVRERYGEGEMLFCALICNGCGAKVMAPTPETLAPLVLDWRIGEYGENADYCGKCLGR